MKKHILEYFVNGVSVKNDTDCVKVMGPTIVTESLEDSDQDYVLDYFGDCDEYFSLCNEIDYDVILL